MDKNRGLSSETGTETERNRCLLQGILCLKSSNWQFTQISMNYENYATVSLEFPHDSDCCRLLPQSMLARTWQTCIICMKNKCTLLNILNLY